MSDVTGERKMVTASGKAEKNTFPLIEAGEYEALLRTEAAQVKAASPSNPEGTPYVSFRAEIQGTAKGENGKNLSMFLNLHLKNVPGKNGKIFWKSNAQLLGLCNALGTEPVFPVIDVTTASGSTVEIVDPAAVLEFLQSHDGQAFKLRIKVQKASQEDVEKGYGDKNEVSYYIPADGGAFA